MSETTNIEIVHNAAKHRFEALVDGELSRVEYRIAGDAFMINHTEVPPALRGQGIASRLIRGALEAARAQRMKVVPRCSFVAAYLARHSEFNDLLR